MDYYSSIKKDIIAATWTNLGIVIFILSEVSHTEKDKTSYQLCVESIKKHADEFTYKIGREFQMQKTN